MELVVDTSAIIAVLVREPLRAALIDVTAGADLLAPPSVHWEVGNAFSAMSLPTPSSARSLGVPRDSDPFL